LTRLRLASLLASSALAAILLVLLFGATGIEPAAVGRMLLAVRPQAFAEIAALFAFNNFLAGEKWRLIIRGLHPAGDRDMPRHLYFAFTSIGTALGQVAPASLSLVLARSLGAHLHGGGALVRGAGATLFDYFFDVLVAAVLALCSVLVLIAGGGGAAWATGAAVLGILAFVLCGRAARLAAGVAGWLAPRGPGRYRDTLVAVSASPLLNPKIARRLLAISAIRFAVLVLIAAIGARTIAADIAVWRLAAALPFSMIAVALAITPGALGVNEWTLAAVLLAFGTPIQVSAEWALAVRVLMLAAAALWGLAGLAIAAATARRPRAARGLFRPHP
jgi:Lysylphosphatidylglycerol synthase TM region